MASVQSTVPTRKLAVNFRLKPIRVVSWESAVVFACLWEKVISRSCAAYKRMYLSVDVKRFDSENFISEIVRRIFPVSAKTSVEFTAVPAMKFPMKFTTIFNKAIIFHAFFRKMHLAMHFEVINWNYICYLRKFFINFKFLHSKYFRKIVHFHEKNKLCFSSKPLPAVSADSTCWNSRWVTFVWKFNNTCF